MERKEFTTADVHVLAALLEQAAKTASKGVISARIYSSGGADIEVQLTSTAFRRLFTEYTTTNRQSLDFPAEIATTIGNTRYCALLTSAEVFPLTPLPAPVA